MTAKRRGWRRAIALGLCLALVGLAPALAREQTPLPTNSAPALAPASAAPPVYHGNLKSKKFHRPGCRYYACPNCQAVFHSRQEALAAGYVPCKVCRP